MCIGIPMRVREAAPDHARVHGRGGEQTIDTRLVGPVRPGEWLLVFQGAARERLDDQRAAEIDATLDLLDAALGGHADGALADPAFELPSRMDPAALAALTGDTPR